jgi:hypothetical protein
MLRYFIRQIKGNRAAGAKWSMLGYFPRWKKALESNSSTMQDRLPWLSFPAIDLLKSTLKRSDTVFEFGGGGSTLFFVDRVAEVVTVEHDADWSKALEEHMKGEQGARWEGHHVPPANGAVVSGSDPSEPLHYASTDEASAGRNYEDYASRIDRYPDGYFDVVLIDGRARTSCLHHAVPKLRSGGTLVLDNAERAHYTSRNAKALAHLEVVLQGMAPCLHNRDFSETRIYRKK